VLAPQTNLAFARVTGYGSAGEQPERSVSFSKQGGAVCPCRLFLALKTNAINSGVWGGAPISALMAAAVGSLCVMGFGLSSDFPLFHYFGIDFI